MKAIRNFSLVLLLLSVMGLVSASPGLAQVPFALATAQTTTGDSSGTCYTYQAASMSVFFTTTGDAVSIDVECYDGATWYTLTGSGLPITVIGSGIRSFSTFSCTHLRTDVKTCTNCSVTTTCQKWKTQ